MENKKHVYIVLFSFLFTFCTSTINVNESIKKKSQLKEIFGSYKQNKPPVSLQVIIYPDFKVNYKFKADLLGELNIDGLWVKKADTLIFSFDMPKKKIIKKLKVKYGKLKKENIEIVILDDIGQPFLGAKVSVDGVNFDIKDIHPIIISSRYIKTIDVKLNDNTYKKIHINKIINKNIEISYEFDEIRPVIYDLVIKKWLIKNNLLMPIVDKKLSFAPLVRE